MPERPQSAESSHPIVTEEAVEAILPYRIPQPIDAAELDPSEELALREQIEAELLRAAPLIQKQVEERVRERLESLPRLIPTTSHGGPDYQERDRWAMVEAGPMCKRDGYLNRRDVIDALDSKKQGE